jgi:hypothetical protein
MNQVLLVRTGSATDVLFLRLQEAEECFGGYAKDDLVEFCEERYR